MVQLIRHLSVALWVVLLFIDPAASAAGGLAEVELDIKAEPTASDWRRFLELSATEQQAIWDYQIKRGKTFADWSWGWRLGWLRACNKRLDAFCKGILIAGLADKAAVVRTDAATRTGNLYAGRTDKNIVAALKSTFVNPRNRATQTAMQVQYRTLYALKQMGSPAAIKQADTLAAMFPDTKTYWQRLNNL